MPIHWVGDFSLKRSIFFFVIASSVAHAGCLLDVPGYKVVPHSVFEFASDDHKECFFAFYTNNENKNSGAGGGGNEGDAIWYAHFQPGEEIKKFDIPKDLESEDWQDICGIDSVSFIDINGDGLRDVTVIGECGTPTYRKPFVFLRKKNGYFFDEKTFFAFSGHNLITIADVKKFFRTGKLPKNDSSGPDKN